MSVESASSSDLTNIPQVIRDLLQEIIENDFAGNPADAAAEISRLGKERFGETRLYPPITRAIMYNLIGDKSQVKFGHLEMVANYLGVPVGVMLVYTRMQASLRDGNSTDINYLKSVLAVLQTSLDQSVLSISGLKEIGTGNLQLDLFNSVKD